MENKETELKEKGLERMIPLKHCATNFAIKKNQVRNILQTKTEKINSSKKASSSKYFPEMRLENMDKSITGIADLIIENDLGVTILDFKTGKIYSDSIEESEKAEQVIKKEYEVQLKLYAHLYFLMKGKYPKALYLVTLSNNFIEVDFETETCEAVYLEALEFLLVINSFISNNDIQAIAKPSVDNCKYCSYRPACNFYSDWLTINFEIVNDLFGIVEKVTQFGNGSLGVQLSTNGRQVLINGLPIPMKEKLESLVGKNIMLYNLKKTKQSINATANNFTTVYE